MLATTKCNHDVSILVHAPPPAASTLDLDHTAAQMTSFIRSATFYITAYVSKGQPHLINLWILLRDGHQRLLQELTAMNCHHDSNYVASRTLTRLLTSTEKRVHKSMPEMESYTSHHFRRIFVTPLVHRAMALRPIASFSTLEPSTDFLVQPDTAGSNSLDTDAASSVAFTRGYQDVDYVHRGAPLTLICARFFHNLSTLPFCTFSFYILSSRSDCR